MLSLNFCRSGHNVGESLTGESLLVNLPYAVCNERHVLRYYEGPIGEE